MEEPGRGWEREIEIRTERIKEMCIRVLILSDLSPPR
jgi:hypothetical protein